MAPSKLLVRVRSPSPASLPVSGRLVAHLSLCTGEGSALGSGDRVAMGIRRAIRRLGTLAALAATVLALAAPTPAAAEEYLGSYLNLIFRDASWDALAPCNPSYLQAHSSNYTSLFTFDHLVVWVEYFGIPVMAPRGFDLTEREDRGVVAKTWVVPSGLPPGPYTVRGIFLTGPHSYWPAALISATARIAPSLNSDCSPKVAPTVASASQVTIRRPSQSVLAHRVRAARRAFGAWRADSPAAQAQYPRARLCGQTICIQGRPGGAWKPIVPR
jgi:hypothetical protein